MYSVPPYEFIIQGVTMILQNEICHIEINIDETYTVGSADNRHYDATLNPRDYRHNDLSKTLAIHISLYSKEYQIALIGPYHSYDSDCAVLEDDILTVLQDDMITQIKITNTSIIRHVLLNCFGCNFAIYKFKNGYIIHGEIEIILLNFDLIKQWSFSGRDIFVTISNKEPFTIRENSICLYDFEDNYYEIDFDGNQLI